jgi:hypothetical protein
VLVTGYDQSCPRMRSGGRRVEDVQMGRPAPLPPPKQGSDLGAPGDPARPGQRLVLPVAPGRRHTGTLTSGRPSPRGACAPSCAGG